MEKCLILVGVTNSNLEITKILLDLLGRGHYFFEFVPDSSGHDFRYSLDTTKISKILDWKPVISLWNGFRRAIKTIKRFKENIGY